ncbi:hypothetical protein KP509_31G071400 [Ceratopteris richardii]|uniref:Riboflavin biosynthesis protein PYRD, chloroplastic n=2 Tax=Ceratopteris richardii TaxID=49495 RepID=A0A8T2QZV3_CERRI|nr:hypothetical protein KP509_31G071400 [Ceratopteris richardii]
MDAVVCTVSGRMQSCTEFSPSSHVTRHCLPAFHCRRFPSGGIGRTLAAKLKPDYLPGAGSLAFSSSCSSSSSSPSFLSSLPKGANEDDAEYIRKCVELARKALGFTSPNPMVGCIIVKDGHIVGEGFHPKAGEPHAEVFALREAGANAKGSTVYVSLEPCNHYGRTPPCSNALVKACVSRVVVGMVDPNPLVSGKGVETLRKAGIEVITGVESQLCEALNEAYIHRIQNKRPFVTLRFSQSFDGVFLESTPVDCTTGSYYSKLLQENDALIALDSALSEDIKLLSSEVGCKQPLRIILSNDLKLPLESNVFDTSHAPSLVIARQQALVHDLEKSSRTGCQTMESLLLERGVELVAVPELNLKSALDVCYDRGFSSVLIDSRGRDSDTNFLGRQAIEDGVVEKVIVDIFPSIGSDKGSGSGLLMDGGSLPLERLSSRISGSHIILEGYMMR